MNVEEIVRQITESITKEASVRAVFGDPIALGGHVIVPVALVNVQFGGGLGMGKAGLASESKTGGGGGGAGGLNVQTIPIGFIHDDGGHVVFSRITHGAGGAEPGTVTHAAKAILHALASRGHG